ncbi:von Willebrand factor A domain-containing protein 5A-like [Podarcis raffonei]|uniref:von Willebrand factor A domain-containing protein 5A-like n=1 Tax=Podarcis raffonei TaxID=65483 RepID=UPI0023294E2F|nr:von Willebrand factor A domain-containing protein 5A-like [Podarcis raffonei]
MDEDTWNERPPPPEMPSRRLGYPQKVPLQSISVAVAIKGFVADVVSELHYKNEEKIPLEVEFVFPLDADAAVYAFEGLMGETKIEAQIMEKEQAQALYEDRLAVLEASVFCVRDPKSRDVFKCMLGNLPPSEEATLKLCYVQALAPEPDGADRFVLPVVLNPRYALQGSEESSFIQDIPRVPERELPYKLSLSATLHSPYGISHVKSNCTLTPLQYATEDHTTAQISLTEGYCLNRDVELLIYYKEVVRKPSLLLEVGKPGADPGSLMGDHVLLLTLYPSPPAPKPGLNATGEFLFLMDCSSSMSYSTRSNSEATTRIQSAKETLIFLLKSLPLGCYFNIYAFGSSYYSFYRKSVKYTQQTMLESLRGVLDLQANLGGTEILQPLKAIYSQPCREGYARQVFVFTDGEVSNIDEVIAEVQSHSKSHRCFSFGIGEGTSSYFIGGIAEASGGRAEFIRSKEQMQAKALRSLKCSLQPEVKHIKLEWHLPPGLEAVLLGSSTQAIFAGERCLMYAQICGQQQTSDPPEGSVVLQYIMQGQTFAEKMDFRLEAEENDRFPVHRLAAQAVLKELEETRSTAKQQLVLETSLSSGVLCAQTAYVVVNMEQGEPLQAPVEFREIPYPNSSVWAAILQGDHCCYEYKCEPSRCESILRRALEFSSKLYFSASTLFASSTRGWRSYSTTGEFLNAQNAVFDHASLPTNESLLLRLVSLQNADGSWSLDANLLSILGLSEAEILGKMPTQVVQTAWTTVLVVLWLHVHFAECSDIWQLLEAKAVGWLHESTGPKLAECVKAGNTFLGCDVSAEVFGL